MKVVFGGQLQNAFCTALTRQNNPERWLAIKGGYYGSLHRYQDKSVYDRAATLAVIAPEIIIDQFVDWELSSDTSYSVKSIEQFNARRAKRFDYDAGAVFNFAKFIISSGFFDDRLNELLRRGGPEINDYYNSTDEMREEFAIQQLSHIIHASIGAHATGSYLALTEDDCEILRVVSSAVVSYEMNISFPLPDLSSLRIVDDDLLPSALINFSPVDAISILSAKQDKFIKRYSASAISALEFVNEEDSRKLLLEAMREAAHQEKRIISAKKIIDVAAKVVGMIGIPLADTIVEQVSSALERERVKRSFHLLRVRMTEITVREYLERSDNIR